MTERPLHGGERHPVAVSHVIWTAEAIAARISRSPDFVRRRLANMPDSPIRRLGGRYYVFADELEAFMRSEGGA